MQIVCPACAKRLQIADDKLPQERQVRLVCPACQERFTFEPHSDQPPADPPPDQTLVSSVHAVATSAVAPPAPASPSSIDITEVGPVPRALVCLDTTSHREEYQNMLPDLGYNTTHTMTNQSEALAYLSQVPYEFFILDATFDGSTLDTSPVLTCLRELPMERRRYMFVALCTPDAATADAMTAYSHSVNLVINHTDMSSGRRILEQHLAEHKRLYRVYRELRQQLGKDI